MKYHYDKSTLWSFWIGESIKQQQNMNNQLGDRIWDQFLLPYHKDLLFQKVAPPMFGSPKKKADDFGLNEEEKKKVNDIVDKCIKFSVDGIVDLSVIFVFVRVNDSINTSAPLFRVRSNENDELISKNKFIDHLGRVYDDWAHFKKTNKWDKSWLCVPYEGFYAIEKDICYEVWDQSSQGNVLNIIDKASSATSIATTAAVVGGTVASLFPPIALIGGAVSIASLIVGAPSAAYGFGRSVEYIIDRATHDQSISSLNSEAHHSWLMTAASVLPVGVLASASGLVLATRASILPSSTIRCLATTLNITSPSVSGLCMINSIHQLSQKEKMTDLDIFNLSTFIFFFTHNSITSQTLSGIIKKTQEEEKKIKLLSPEDQQKFDAQLKIFIETFEKGKDEKLHGKTELIREIKNKNNSKRFEKNCQITSDDIIINKFKISQKTFSKMNNGEGNELIELTKKLSNNYIGMKRFKECAKPIFSKYDIKLEYHIESNIYTLKQESTGVGEVQPIEVNGLANLSKECLFPEVERIIIKVVNKIAKKCSDFVKLFIQIVKCLIKEVTIKLSNNKMSIKIMQMIEEECRNAITNKSGGKKFAIEDKLNESFTNHQSTRKKVNTESNSELNHMTREKYNNLKYFPVDNEENYLTPCEYFCIATEIAGDIPSEIIWIQSGSTLECRLISKKYGNVTIFFDHIENNTKITTTLMGVTLKKTYKINTAIIT